MRRRLRPRPGRAAERLTGLLALLSNGMLASAFGYALVCIVATFEAVPLPVHLAYRTASMDMNGWSLPWATCRSTAKSIVGPPRGTPLPIFTNVLLLRWDTKPASSSAGRSNELQRHAERLSMPRITLGVRPAWPSRQLAVGLQVVLRPGGGLLTLGWLPPVRGRQSLRRVRSSRKSPGRLAGALAVP